MAITDLTGTSWQIRNGFYASAGYGIFHINANGQKGNAFYEFDALGVGYSNATVTEAERITILRGGSFVNGWGKTMSGYSTPPAINIIDGEDVTNADLIAWLESEATLLSAPEEPKTTITYNNETIATLEAGQTATVKTAETEVDHDIVITPVFPIEIAYGDIIATAEAGQTATVKCANTEADFDIVVSAKAEEANKLAGIWVLNEVIIPPAQTIQQDIIYTIPEQPDSNFSDGYKIKFLGAGDGRVFFYYHILTGGNSSNPVYVNDAWSKQGWRTVDFGSTAQDVSEEFYKCFTANATKQ